MTIFLEEQAASEQLELLTVTNPARVLDDEMPLPVPIVEMRSGLWSRVKAIFGG